MKKTIAILGLCLSTAFAQDAYNARGGSFTDPRDNQRYRTVQIGNQTWMAENLNYKAGDSYCYENSNANCQKYGRLYDWYTAMKACPRGWHLPAMREWNALIDLAGGTSSAGQALRTKSGWKNDANGTDKYGFSALPGGRIDIFPGFDGRGGISINTRSVFLNEWGFWWTADKDLDKDHIAYYWLMTYYDSVSPNSDLNTMQPLSVRCVED